MANHKSAQKRARQRVKRTERNTAIRSHMRGVVRAFREALQGGDAEKAAVALETATRTLRKAASQGILPKATASRRVSRLVLAHNSVGSQP